MVNAGATDLVVAIGGTQGNVSGHLRRRSECGLGVDRPDGDEVFYPIAGSEVVAALRAAKAPPSHR